MRERETGVLYNSNDSSDSSLHGLSNVPNEHTLKCRPSITGLEDAAFDIMYFLE